MDVKMVSSIFSVLSFRLPLMVTMKAVQTLDKSIIQDICWALLVSILTLPFLIAFSKLSLSPRVLILLSTPYVA